jgi:hypothetical protein
MPSNDLTIAEILVLAVLHTQKEGDGDAQSLTYTDDEVVGGDVWVAKLIASGHAK